MGTPDYCPACGTAPQRDGQRFCGNCREPLTVDVDREQLRYEASGLLPNRLRTMLRADVDGEREHRHERTQVLVQEHVRKALFDFHLITEWEGLANTDVIRLDSDDLEPEDCLAKFVVINHLVALLYATVSIDGIAVMLRFAVEHELRDVLEGDEEIDVALTVDGERVNTPLEELMNETVKALLEM